MVMLIDLYLKICNLFEKFYLENVSVTWCFQFSDLADIFDITIVSMGSSSSNKSKTLASFLSHIM